MPEDVETLETEISDEPIGELPAVEDEISIPLTAFDEILSAVNQINERIDRIEERSDPSLLKFTDIPDAEADIEAGVDMKGPFGEYGEVFNQHSKSVDQLFPSAGRELREGDIVRLRDDCDKAQRIKANTKQVSAEAAERIKETGVILGVVMDYKFTSRKNNTPKFKVRFPGVTGPSGDGVLLSDLELVRRAGK